MLTALSRQREWGQEGAGTAADHRELSGSAPEKVTRIMEGEA